MSARLKRQSRFLHVLLDDTLTRRQKVHFLQRATRDQVLVLGEIAVNVLRGNIAVNDEHTPRLMKYRNSLRRLAQSPDKLQWRDRHTVIVQNTQAVLTLLNAVKDNLEAIIS
jgi:hypothetical protein